MSGDVHVRFCESVRVRFPRATHLVVCFQYRSDAERFQDVLPKRFATYGLKLHPAKTRLLAFGRYAEEQAQREGKRKAETFGFLGFTLYCGKSRAGRFAVKYKTMSKRLRRGLLRWAAWCRDNRHRRVLEQRERLRVVLHGHYQYYGLPTNSRSLVHFYRGTLCLWRKWLGRRDRSTAMTWEKFEKILQQYPLPAPRIRREATSEQLVLYGEFA